MSNYTAKELLSDWYSTGVKGEKSSNELELRQKSISKLMKNKDTIFWVDILRIAYDLPTQSEESFSKFVDFFKTEDTVFPLMDNSNLVRTLACCAVGQKIENSRSDLSDALSLGVIVIPSLGRNINIPVPQLTQFSINNWTNECITVRKLSDNKVVEIKPSLTKIEFEHAHNTAEYREEIINYFTAITNDLKHINTLSKALSDTNDNNMVLSEESNVLWWLFGGYSRDFGIKLSELGFPDVVIQVSKELADLTEILPGFSQIDSFIKKALDDMVGEKDLKSSDIKDFLSSSSKKNVLNGFIAGQPEQIIDLLPCHGLIKSKIESEGTGDWLLKFNKLYKSKGEVTLTAFEFAKQLYLERMFVSSYNQLK